MELAGAARHRKSPAGVSAREKRESIEPSRRTTTKLAIALCPRLEWSRWEASDMDKAQRANERERVSQSNLRVDPPLSYPRSGISQNVPGGNGARGSGAT